MDQREIAAKVKQESMAMAALSGETRDHALYMIKKALNENRDMIFSANKKDLETAETKGIPSPVLGRLRFDDHKLEDVMSGIDSLIDIADPISRTVFRRSLDEGLILEKVTCPIGVIGVIFEARPDALVQISSLCIKSGNCAILKGGSEAAHTNKALFDVIRKAGLEAGLPDKFITLLESHAEVDELLKCDDSVDLIIPRGSNSFVRYIMDNSNIPVMGHADGICHIYVDKDADIEKAVKIVYDAKTQYTAACNAAETLLVNKDIAERFLPEMYRAAKGKIKLIGCDRTLTIIDCEKATEKDYSTEYLDLILTVKITDDIDEAIRHINRYGSHHTDCIVTENDEAAEKFMTYVDSAGVYRNCSTRFADGFRYGFGAEVGISTGKLHARGPVGVEGLVTYKYRLTGNGHIVQDYAEGKKEFHFKDIM